MEQQKLDPLRRVFIPTELRETNGDWSLQTLDGTQYRRGEDGAIRHRHGKVNGKVARRTRARARKAAHG